MIFNLRDKKQIQAKIKKIFQKKKPIIISGGNTIKKILNNYNKKIFNKKILISDERLVKTTSKLRNDFFFKKLIKKRLIKPNQIISYKLSTFNKQELQKFNTKIKKIKFYYALLSLGSKGHFASIFNNNKKADDFYFINNSPKFPKNRVTVSLKKISKTNKIYFIASRKNKKKEIRNFKSNKLLKNINKNKITLLTFQ